MQMVVMLANIVHEASRFVGKGHLADVFDRSRGKRRILQQVVAIGHIGHVVLVVMKLQGFLRHERAKRIIGVRQGRQFEGHVFLH
jgi:hypothetical protein